ncbi:NUDIX domain-containing protein [Streptomyces goshikiensis]|uniref:NUDIX hydrolase n=1 Tax=Streptomyces goshikiensis TaxID=1942 RepID=UPI0037241F05
MPIARSHIRELVTAYLERHPGERELLAPLWEAPAAGHGATDRAGLPGDVTCSAVVIDRARRVLHVHRPASGGTPRAPGGHAQASDRTLLEAALRGLREEAGIPPGALCVTAEYLSGPLDIAVHAVEANPAESRPAHQRYDFRFVFCLADAEEVAASGSGSLWWLPFDQVGSPTLRAKLLASGLDGGVEPVNASALIHDGRGRYLLHLRDDVPGIWEPGSWALLGGGREPQDASLEETVRRELREEAGLEPAVLEPLAVESATGTDGLTVPVRVFAGRWTGDPAALPLAEGVMLAWFDPGTMPRLRLSPGTLDLVRRHAARRPSASGRESGAPAVPHVVGVHLYLERDGRVLLGLRHPDSAYAGSTHHFLAGHCERESAVSCLVREAREEAGLVIDPAEVELAHLVHVVDGPGAQPRMQLVFRARRWQGSPEVREPDRCLSWGWWPADALPDPIVPYARAAVEGIRAGRPYTELGWA